MSFLRRSSGKYASTQMRKPLARSEDLVIEEIEDELLIYDRNNKRAHCLGATAARVWRACDGTVDVDGLSSALDLSRDTVLRALEDLEACELLDVHELQVINGNGNGNGLTRRELAWRSAKVGAAAATVPLVYSIAVPNAMAQASPTPFLCQIYTADDCGSPDSIAGCCCCCQAGGTCKGGGSVATCGTANWVGCGGLDNEGEGHCSNTNGTIPATPSGCCANGTPVSGCGCGWGPVGTTQCTSGSACGSACCDTTPGKCFLAATPTITCTAGTAGCVCPPCATSTTNTNCVPCCNGSPLSSGAMFGCCTPGHVTTCPTAPCPTTGCGTA